MTNDTGDQRPTGANLIATMTAEERAKLEARFWPKTRSNEATGCLEWTGGVSGEGCGYGSFHVAGVNSAPHRVAFVLARGPIPARLLIRHKCNNPLCVRADHLEPGTHTDNRRDMMDAARGCVGPGSQRRPLSAKEAAGLLGSRILGLSLKDVVRAWDVSASTAKAVRGGRSYAEAIDRHTDDFLAAEAETAQRASDTAPDQA